MSLIGHDAQGGGIQSACGNVTVPTLAELIALRARVVKGRRWQGALAAAPGGHRAPQFGRGMEFAEVRPYQPGDDIRSMDWRHTARRGRPFTKLFQEERERPVLVVVDQGPSLRFGTRVAFKSVVAARTAALLAWAAVAAGDRVGGLVWDGWGGREVPPLGRDAGALALIRHLAGAPAASAGAAAGLAVPLQSVGRVVRPGTLVVVVSDFHAFDAAASAELARLGRHAVLALVQVFDPIEAQPPPAGVYRLTDGSRERVLDLRSPAARAAWAQPFAARQELLAGLARRTSAARVALATTDDPALALRVMDRGAAR